MAATTPAVDKAAVEQYLRHLELWVPQIKVVIDDPKPTPVPSVFELPVHLSFGQASKDTSYYISADGRHILRGEVFDLKGNPFANDLKSLRQEGQPSFGPATAPMTIAIFSDFECPLCKEEAKVLRENVPKAFPNDVRVVFLDMPLDAIHPWARPASIAGRCVYAQNPTAFWSYFDWIYAHQGDIKPDNLKEKVLGWAKESATIVDAAKLGQCMDTRATEAEVDRSVAEAKRLQVDGSTPTSFLNGRRIVGAQPWPNFEQIIKLDLEYAKAHAK